jgi:hypothetical protein
MEDGWISGGVKQGLVKCKRDDVAESEMVSHDRGAQRTGEFFGCPSSLELTERIEVDKTRKGEAVVTKSLCKAGRGEREDGTGRVGETVYCFFSPSPSGLDSAFSEAPPDDWPFFS